MRKFALFLPAALVLATFGAVAAQQPKKVPRVGYLSALNSVSEADRSNGVRLGLSELGYVEGQNSATEFRYAEGKVDRLTELAAELVRLKVDVIVVSGDDRQVRAAMNAASTIPIVMMGAGVDPVEAGLVKSIARPGGNVTGFTSLATQLGGKRLELLKDTVAKLARVAILYDSAASGTVREVKELLPGAARALRLTLQEWEVHRNDEFERVFAAMAKRGPEALYVLPGPLMRDNPKRTVSYSLKYRLPTVHNSKTFVDAGGLLSYGSDQTDSYRRVAYFVDRILKGTKPADLPVEHPTKFEFVVNLKTAKQIGLTIPPEVLARATRIIRQASLEDRR